jgi:nucleotide-binding universal stress UspA family protein
MKKIIVPVDFSIASTNALLFDAEVAKRASAHLLIVNIPGARDGAQEAKAKLSDLSADLKKSFGPGLNIESQVVSGALLAVLKKIISAERPSLLVMGTKGASGMKRILIGSNTVKVIANIKVPVLVIPEVAKFDNFLDKGKNRVVLATDLEALEDDHALDTLKKIALLITEPKVRVVNVRKKNTQLDFLKRMERNALLSVFSPELESERITVFSGNVMSGIHFYLDQNPDTGLLAMIARGDTGNLVERHYTREMASYTHLPLLVLHDAKVKARKKK